MCGMMRDFILKQQMRAEQREIKKCTKYYVISGAKPYTNLISSYNQKFTQDQNIKTLYVH